MSVDESELARRGTIRGIRCARRRWTRARRRCAGRHGRPHSAASWSPCWRSSMTRSPCTTRTWRSSGPSPATARRGPSPSSPPQRRPPERCPPDFQSHTLHCHHHRHLSLNLERVSVKAFLRSTLALRITSCKGPGVHACLAARSVVYPGT